LACRESKQRREGVGRDSKGRRGRKKKSEAFPGIATRRKVEAVGQAEKMPAKSPMVNTIRSQAKLRGIRVRKRLWSTLMILLLSRGGRTPAGGSRPGSTGGENSLSSGGEKPRFASEATAMRVATSVGKKTTLGGVGEEGAKGHGV